MLLICLLCVQLVHNTVQIKCVWLDSIYFSMPQYLWQKHM